jgi:hypothetical protein
MTGSYGKLRSVVVALICLMALNIRGSEAPDTEKNFFSRLQGIWEHTSYGDIYVIGKRFARIYQYTRATCLQSVKLDKKEFGELLIDIVVQDNGAVFTAIPSDTSAFRLHFSRLETLPEVCSEEKRIKGFVPVKIFEHVWHTFNDYYAFFKERGVD